MRFLDLHVESFLRFAEPFDLPLGHGGLILVEGRNLDRGDAFDQNAVGKSAALEALLWVLYGKMSRYGDRRLSPEDVCHPTRGADVSVTFETDAGVFTAQRVQRPGKSPSFRITPFGKSMPLRGTGIHAQRATEDVARIIGFDYETARSALWLQGTGMTVTTSGFTGQMRLLEHVLRFDLFAEAAKQEKVQREKYGVQEVSSRSEILRWAQAAESEARTVHEMESLEESALEEQFRAELAKYRDLAETEPEWASRVTKAREAVEWATRVLSQARAVLGAAEDLTTRAALFDPERETLCPTCSQPVEPTMAQTLRASAEGELVEAKRVVEKAQKAFDADRKILDAALEVHGAAREAKEVAGQIQESLRALLDRKQKRLGVIQAARGRWEQAQAKELEATERLAVATREKGKSEFWLKAFGGDGLKGEILAQAAPILNQEALRYSDILTDGFLRVEFQPIREGTTDDMLKITGEAAGTYRGCSGGERRRVDWIVALALRGLARWRLGTGVNLAIYDEVFENLDESGLRRAVQVLQQDMDETETVYVVTHNPTLKMLFPGSRTLRITRECGESHVEWV